MHAPLLDKLQERADAVRGRADDYAGKVGRALVERFGDGKVKGLVSAETDERLSKNRVEFSSFALSEAEEREMHAR